MRRERHGCEHREDVDDDRVRAGSERGRGADAGEGPDEVDDEQDPLAPVAITDDGDERCHERARHHAGEQDEPDGARTVGLERDDAQRDDGRPFRGVEASPRQLRPAERGVVPQLADRCHSPSDATDPDAHAPNISGWSRHVQADPGATREPPANRRGPAQAAAAAAGSASTSRRNCPV